MSTLRRYSPGLSAGDLATVTNLERLGVHVNKKATAFTSTFRTTKSKSPTVHERQTEVGLYKLNSV
jgi:hypothetical protein